MLNLTILLQAAEGGGGFMNSQMLLLVGMFVIMYFFFIRPQQKKRKEAENFRSSLQKGDKVVTIGGIHGKISDIQESTVVITCESGKFKIDKSAISGSSAASQQEIEMKK